MKNLKSLLVLVLMSTALAFALGVGTTTGQDSAEGAGTLYVVEMYDFFMDPPGLRLESGDRVAWIMLEDHLNDGHSATGYHPDHDKVLRIPEEADSWSTPLMFAFGEWAELTFEIPGVHDYFCIPHETEGMVGRLIVDEPLGGPGTQPGSMGMSPAAQSTIPTVDEIMGISGEIFNTQGLINTAVFHLRTSSSAQDARAVLNDLESKINSGAGVETSLYEALNSVDQLQPFMDGLSSLRSSIGPGNTIDDVVGNAEALKFLLDEANQQLIANGNGA